MSAAWRIVEDDLSGAAIRALLERHFAGMLANSPAGSCHFLDFEGLKAPGVTFWSIHLDAELAGCGALKMLDARHGEIKSMRTADGFLRRGVAARMLGHIMAEAKARGLERLSLETGSGAAFEPAQALYRRHGFVECGPFGAYRPDPFSRFMTRAL
ncbi:GNAT family N-acetyltransferase [Sphingopyxis flava]|uniref:Putative acetyltransferase n=1 Tax=Sphingopyxis flava TaxID=1507287 RepID=A0A1T5B6J7_9SPHN|nr:GNAT family N-acetyltransferase [Sphingopyxis flava]SKB42901.1 putative acetyltransferase [Sphingopyxis flava]